jgi:hypothetical protein
MPCHLARCQHNNALRMVCQVSGSRASHSAVWLGGNHGTQEEHGSPGSAGGTVAAAANRVHDLAWSRFLRFQQPSRQTSPTQDLSHAHRQSRQLHYQITQGHRQHGQPGGVDLVRSVPFGVSYLVEHLAHALGGDCHGGHPILREDHVVALVPRLALLQAGMAKTRLTAAANSSGQPWSE